MSDQCKFFIKNIPNNVPDDKFLEILVKNFEISRMSLQEDKNYQ